MRENGFVIISVQVGKQEEYTYKETRFQTAMYKHPVAEPLYLSSTRLEGDEQSDLKHHGGPDKAILLYSYDHYPYWEKELKIPLGYAAFGENITVSGLTEENAHIGDIFTWGDAVIQITQPRQPCHKMGKRYDLPDMPLRMQQTGFTGFYFRVLQEGWVSRLKPFSLLQPHPLRVSVSYANRIMHHERNHLEGIRRILEVDALSASWRFTLTNRLHGKMEDVKARLEG